MRCCAVNILMLITKDMRRASCTQQLVTLDQSLFLNLGRRQGQATSEKLHQEKLQGLLQAVARVNNYLNSPPPQRHEDVRLFAPGQFTFTHLLVLGWLA